MVSGGASLWQGLVSHLSDASLGKGSDHRELDMKGMCPRTLWGDLIVLWSEQNRLWGVQILKSPEENACHRKSQWGPSEGYTWVESPCARLGDSEVGREGHTIHIPFWGNESRSELEELCNLSFTILAWDGCVALGKPHSQLPNLSCMCRLWSCLC